LQTLISIVLFQGTLSILEEENHIKDVLSRIVVEMTKREWPQHWPDMLMELDALSRQGVCSAVCYLCVLVLK
jgi:exportin-5